MCIALWESYEKRRKYDWPVRMAGTEEALPMLCELLKNQDEIKCAGRRASFFSHGQMRSTARSL